MGANADAAYMSPAPAVRCCDCHFTWNSAAMAEGLKLLGSCPKCGGCLEFRAAALESAAPAAAAAGTAPHLVLGIPRR
jgi:ssDNA-binding Zn-finger/Zn-ribbon topoisomerase 1